MNITKKIVASIVGFSMVVMMAPVSVGATTDIAALQAEVERLTALVAQLRAQMTGAPATGAPAACSGVTFTANLSVGSSGAAVKCLQVLLNQSADTQVAASGPGSPGKETTYFGPATKAAVVKFQNKYAAEILTPVGLTAGTGFVGAKTRAKLNALLTTGVTPPPVIPPPVIPPPATSTPATSTPVTGAEGTLTVDWQATPTGVTVREGETKNVAAFKVKATGSSIKVQRVDLQMESYTVPWKGISSIALYDGANLIKEMAVNKENLIENTAGLKYTARFTASELFTVDKDGSKVITVQVKALSTLPSVAPAYLYLGIPSNGVRGVDGVGINQYAAASGIKTFNIQLANNAILKFSLNANSPKSRAVVISSTADNEVELTRVDLKAENRNLKLVKLNVNVTTNGFHGHLKSLRLYDGNELLGERDVSNGAFENLEVQIAKDATKTLNVKLVVTDTANGGSVQLTVTKDFSNALDSDYNSAIRQGDAVGKTVYLYNAAPIISDITATASAKDNNATTGAETIDAKITFSVTAEGGDIWIASTTAATGAVNIVGIEPSGTTTVTNISNVVLSSSATKETWGYKVPKGQKVSFTFDAAHDPAAPAPAGYYRIKVVKLVWNTEDDGNNAIEWDEVWAVGDLKTGYVYLTAN